MSKQNYIFISPGRSQFFRSDINTPIEGFRVFKCYKLANGDIDYQSHDNDRQDLIDNGWEEIDSPQYLTVNLYYMKESGKYYSTGELKIRVSEVQSNPAKSWYDTRELVRELLKKGELPGLVKGSRFDIFMSCEQHPCYVPTLFKISNM
ncbi:hypothetical protein PJM36_0146 [Salmonella phage vB_SenM_UTK0005]|uniref:Uncharacterized protein n=1 Tax=Salmonella phage STML-13-1 TaxID=1204530 RepID=K4I2Q9_9CAUD|nr:hypothetical protein FDI91_gp107 [Salmonella phage STML-13-1]EBI9227118.1 hypothetical protein [Salmonella enterica]EDL0983473.1 hypothetical protein [Salmonella enterica subsp. enterica serovar Typhimurium]EDW4917971.1 hypothetical protein [Salmonella enterica subsp. enterica]QPX73991.1 hypothetical protein [Salmonella phage AR2819]QPX74562.1 hypothetical protein Sajous1_159 [Salmonella phage Sajous1]UYL83767.1 nucleotide-binding protein [Salmonella phage Guerrero]WDR21431.1 hypothetical